MNNKTKGILMLMPVISILIAIFVLMPIFIFVFGMVIAIIIIGAMTYKGLDLLQTPNKTE